MSDNNWWFTTVGKGNKERQIAVSETMLKALKKWRKHLGLSRLPSPADDSPLLPKTKGIGPIKSGNYIRKIVQYCFDQAVKQLNKDNMSEEAETLIEATVHWFRRSSTKNNADKYTIAIATKPPSKEPKLRSNAKCTLMIS